MSLISLAIMLPNADYDLSMIHLHRCKFIIAQILNLVNHILNLAECLYLAILWSIGYVSQVNRT